jgi:hypothetical protein
MGELADRLDGLVIAATSPDRQISTRVRGSAETVEVSFRRDAYRRYEESTLAEQLGRLAALTFARYRRDEQEIVDGAFAMPLRDDGTDYGPERRRYLEAVKRLMAVGATDDGAIRISSRCLVAWQFSIVDGSLRRWSEREFLTGLQVAVRRLLAHYGAQVFALKDAIYDLGYPAGLRRATGLPVRVDRQGGAR